jgi:DNA repair exonuclease SbcCD ATPase subunit
MDIDNIQSLIPAAGAIATLGGAWLTIRKIAKDASKQKREQAAEILHAAKEEDALLKAKLEAKIESVKAQLANLESSVNKDLDHLKETYSGEIRNLGQKIEELRSELKTQHGQLVTLLTEMIKKSR